MLRSLFARLTPTPALGAPLFNAAVAVARRPHWYMQGEIDDNVDGRFAVLATVLALVTVRLEQGGAAARGLSAALVERFVETMDAEHRQMGVSDPSLGKQIRKLVASLANRVELWREAVVSGAALSEPVRASLYRGAPPSEEALTHATECAGRLWMKLSETSDEAIMEGRIE